jgi:4-hydroxybenzoate polyprenyltransferase
MKNILALMRPHQYVKNIFIFLPLFFVGSISEQVLLLNAFWAFLAFSLAASAIYTLNDFFDIEEDRAHPTKKFRPLASGVISKNQAFVLFAVLIVVSLVLMFYLS